MQPHMGLYWSYLERAVGSADIRECKVICLFLPDRQIEGAEAEMP